MILKRIFAQICAFQWIKFTWCFGKVFYHFTIFGLKNAKINFFKKMRVFIAGFFFQIKVQVILKVSKGAKIRNRYNQVPHLTQDNNGKETNLQLYTTNENQEVNPFPTGDHKAQISRRAQRQQTQDRKNIKDPQKKYRLGKVSKIFYWRA